MKRTHIYFGIIGTLFLVSSTSLVIVSCTKSNTNNSNDTHARTDTWNYLANAQEEYLNKNSVSILTTISPNSTWLKNYFNNFNNSVNDNTDDTYWIKNVFSGLLKIIDKGALSTTASLGTGWILDYSKNSETSNLVNYYIATNIHVLDTSWQWKVAVSESNDTITLNVPASRETSNAINFYLSQPQGSTTNANNRQEVLVNNLAINSGLWYKTSTNVSNFATNVLPIGAVQQNSSQIIGSGLPYDFTMTYESLGTKNTLFFYRDSNNNYKFSIDNYSYNNLMPTSDLGLLKITEDVSQMTTTSNNNLTKTIYKNMNTMFTTNTNDNETKVNSSYIAKLNKLINLAEQGQKNSEEFKKLFLFEDSKSTTPTEISIAGFPGNSTENGWYSSINSNTISSGLVNKNASSLKDSRPTIEYNYNGQFNYNVYDYSKDWLLRNVNLMGGSSGSQAMTSDYKALGIYWGVLTNNFTNISDGIITVLYSENDKNSLIYRYLEYINRNDTNSQLLRLFKVMNQI